MQLIAGFCKELGFEECINKRMPKASHHISISRLLMATMSLVWFGLGFVSRTLHTHPE